MSVPATTAPLTFENLMKAGNAPNISLKNVKVVPAPAASNGRPASSARAPAAFGAGGEFATIINAAAPAAAAAAAVAVPAVAVPAAAVPSMGVIMITKRNGEEMKERTYTFFPPLKEGSVLFSDNRGRVPVGTFRHVDQKEQTSRVGTDTEILSRANIVALGGGRRSRRRIRIRKTKKQRACKGRKSRRN
jgi:hypothetical protein